MQDNRPYQAVTKHYELTEGEASYLKNRLAVVRRQHLIELRAPRLDKRMMVALQKEIDTLEYKLAHANIVDNESPEDSRQNEMSPRFLSSTGGLFNKVRRRVAEEFHSWNHI